jgi:hypothetical protein
MFKATNKYLLLFLILVFSFTYRVLLMHWATYPSGADIGLHNSVIYSVTQGGNADFFWNNYQMGGGVSLTFPGYHIFVSYVMFLTGMPDYLAHSLVVSFFSTVIVACVFLVTRAVWAESTAFIAAFLVAISRFDIEMLLWGGYPNVITLMLIPLTFYLYLQRERFSLFPFLATTTVLAGAIYLTHSLSAVMFAIMTFIIVILAMILSRKIGVARKKLAVWFLPLLLGAALVSPFLINAVPAYLGASSETFRGGVSDIRLALLSTRVLPLEYVLPLFLCVVFFFLFSKEYKGRYLTLPAILLTVWILVPMFFTQGYLVGLYTDYNRFLYFVLSPLLILIALGIDHGSDFFSRIIATYLSFTADKLQTSKALSRLKSHLTRRNIYSSFLLGFLLVAFLAVPIFLFPSEGVRVQSFYQVMTDPGYEAIQWARQNTQTGSVFVSDALYGWWFSGFAQRPTLSAVDPQYLTLSREFEPAKAAKSLLDTDYAIDNGLIQVREDGGYIGRHNPMFLAKLNWTYFPYPFFNFNNGAATIMFREGNEDRFVDLTQLPVIDMHSENSSDQASISVRKGNEFLNYTERITVYKGVRFVNMSVTVDSTLEDVSIYGLRFILQTKGVLIDRGKTVGFLDEGAKVLGQMIFSEKQPRIYQNGPELLYSLDSGQEENVEILLGVFSITDNPAVYRDPETKARLINGILDGDLTTAMDKVADLPLDVFDYQKALREWNVSYVACRDSEIIPKLARDPAFSLVFINGEVAVFMVKRSSHQGGTTASP